MTFSERVLYHQVHPLKIFTDVATAIIAIDLLWQHFLVPGLVIALGPPALVSFAIIGEVDLERYRRSGMGAYLRRYMTPAAQALRLFGAGVMLLAAWDHVPVLILGAIALIAGCWANGIFREAISARRRSPALPPRVRQ